jgi:hypothetical protein
MQTAPSDCPHARNAAGDGTLLSDRMKQDPPLGLGEARPVPRGVFVARRLLATCHKRGKTCHERGKTCHERDKTCHKRGKTCHERDKTCHKRGKTCHERGKTCHERDETCHERDKTCHERDKTCHENGKTCQRRRALVSICLGFALANAPAASKTAVPEQKASVRSVRMLRVVPIFRMRRTGEVQAGEQVRPACRAHSLALRV